jgi:hypothetical protein
VHGRVNPAAVPKIPRVERDLRRDVALVAGEHAHLSAGLDQPGNDRSSQAAGAASNEDWRCHASSLTFGPVRGSSRLPSLDSVPRFYDGSEQWNVTIAVRRAFP